MGLSEEITMTTYEPDNDLRLDPRVRAILKLMPTGPGPTYTSRDQVLAAARTPEALAGAETTRQLVELCDTEDVVTSRGLELWAEKIESQPDGNIIHLQVVRPEGDKVLPCVYYIHGGGMASLSCTMGNYRAWAKILAHYGVCVVMVEFRNSMQPSSVEDIAPFPGGLNDCISGLKWVHGHAKDLRIDPAKIVVSGEIGGGNLALAVGLQLKNEGRLDLVKGIYALCPFIAGEYPRPELPSTSENNGIFINLVGNGPAMAYGIEHLTNRNPVAWPYWASLEELTGFPQTVISVNECDPLRDEGIAFYRKLVQAGVNARCRNVLGTMHATELIPMICPEITADAAAHIAAFAAN